MLKGWDVLCDQLSKTLLVWTSIALECLTNLVARIRPVGRSKSPGYGHLKLPHLMIAVSAA
ncbi:hypothetical protein, partial [Bradyrhizobium liaoningense]|uniref:hypothetical protein n=1 Tax=Bradyrhizobium liaoningense TaxID=43992 RepID=UPI001BADF4D2